MLEKLKSTYLLWYGFCQELPKTHRYTLGQRIDAIFIETIEIVALAAFLPRNEKQPSVRRAIQKVDALKILCLILWETRSFDNKKYVALSTPPGCSRSNR